MSESDTALNKIMQRYQQAVENQNFQEADDVVAELFSMVMAQCENDLSPEFQLAIAACQCEERNHWHGAETIQYQILAQPDLAPSMECKAHLDLACLYQMLHRDAEALEHARLATAAARRTELPMALAMALRGEARCLLRCGRMEAAAKTLNEAMMQTEADKQFDMTYASLLVLRAECALGSGAIADCRRDLVQAETILKPLTGMQLAAGVHSEMTRWWAITARVRAVEGDLEGAVQAWQEALSDARYVASLPHVESEYARVTVADVLAGLAGALSACAHEAEAAAAMNEHNKILSSMNLPC